jgi:hypothetical protein
MEESWCVMSRFIKPRYKFVPIDDVDFELISSLKMALKVKPKPCVVIGIGELNRREIKSSDSSLENLFETIDISATMVWGSRGKAIIAAKLSSVTIGDSGDDEEQIAMEFAADLLDFFDSCDYPELEDALGKYFVQAD